MLRIILGILIIIGSLKSMGGIVGVNSISTPDDEAFFYGVVAGKIILLILSIWLIYSGIRKIRQKGNKKSGGVSAWQFLKEFFGSYTSFIEKYFKNKKPPFFFSIFWMFGISIAFNFIIAWISHGNYVLNWLYTWLFALILGLILALMGYWVMGSIYHIFVRLSGGEKNAKVSRYIYLYSGLPVFIVVIFSMIINMLVYGNEYLLGNIDEILSYIWLFLKIVALIYSIVLGYIGVRNMQKTKKIRSVIFFIIIPILFRLSVFGYSFYVAYNAYNNVDTAIEEINSQNEPDINVGDQNLSQ